MATSRVAYYDWLRVAATIAVVLLHCASLDWHASPVASLRWNALNLYDSAVRWCVPIFFMLTGALFLGRRQAPASGSLLRRALPRLLGAWAVWSVVYFGVTLMTSQRSVRGALARFPITYYHLWFLPAIIGVYIALPVLWWVVRDRRIAHYFVLVGAAVASLTPFARQEPSGVASALLNSFAPPIVLGYAVLVVAGHLLATTEHRPRTPVLVLIAAAGVLVTAVLTYASSRLKGQPTEVWYAYTTLNVMLTSGAVFLLFKRAGLHRVGEQTRRAVAWLSDYSFGVYLIHPLVLLGLTRVAGPVVHNAYVGPVVATVLALLGSYPLSWCLKRLPAIGSYVA